MANARAVHQEYRRLGWAERAARVPGPGIRLLAERGWTLEQVRERVAGCSPGAKGA
ncbi:MAG TPA: hypothetical protein VGM60_00050 [Pseudonocardia sp.]|uniref:hypothetical protein n=1 Tax=Pseudonocardia sp. TaxID=60912 RepID=UPI002F40DBC8